MTLKEKFENIIFNYIGSEWDRRDVSINLETDVDEFAIGFADWVTQQPEVKIIKKSGLNNSYMRMSSKELLEIYKKEKGL